MRDVKSDEEENRFPCAESSSQSQGAPAKKRGESCLSFLPCVPKCTKRILADRRTGRTRRTGGIGANHARLVGEERALAGHTGRRGRPRQCVGQARVSRVRERISALGPSSQDGVNQIRRG